MSTLCLKAREKESASINRYNQLNALVAASQRLAGFPAGPSLYLLLSMVCYVDEKATECQHVEGARGHALDVPLLLWLHMRLYRLEPSL